MKYYLEYVDATSSKFWSVETEGNLMTVTYGKIGTAGKSDTKSMPSAEAAEKEALKQANGKMKKGYVEKEAPESSVVKDSPQASAGTKPAELKKTKVAAKPERPADVSDDGLRKEWHGEDYWDACFWDAETYDNLDKSAEDKTKSASKKQTKTESGAPEALTESQIEDFQDEFFDACGSNDLDDYIKYIEKLRPVMSKDDFDKMLAEGMIKAHDSSWRDIELDSFVIIERLLSEGASLPDKENREDETLDAIAEIYLTGKGTKTYQNAVDEYFMGIFSPVAEEADKLFRTAISRLAAGEYADKDGISENKLSIDRLGFAIHANRGIEVRISGALSYSQDSVVLEKTEYTAVKLDDIDSDLETKYIALCMRPVVEKMAEEGLFDNITTLGHLIVTTRYDSVFFEKTVNEAAREDARKTLEERMEFLEATEDWEKTKDDMRATVKTYLVCGFDADGMRSLNVMKRYIYSGNDDASADGYYCLEESKKLMAKYFIPYTMELAKHSYENFNWGWYERYLYEILDKDPNYAPALQALESWEKEEKTLTYGVGKGGGDNEDNDDKTRNKPKGSYTDADLMRETNTMIARANQSGRIDIRFKTEGQKGYTDVLDYLVNLMEKDYSKANDGYEMGVYFAAKPEFPKIKFHDYMPRVPEMALFHKAMMYDELHEKVRRFVELTVNEYDHYHNLDGEYSTVCGTFAAISAAMYSPEFADLALRLAEETDGEHEEIAYHFTDELQKKHGVTPLTVAAIYELGMSCDHDIRSCKELYTIPENLEAFLEHYNASAYSFKKNRLIRFMNTIAGSSKGILKKIKEYFDGSKDAKVKAIYSEFYNLALELLGEKDGKDYGAPIYADVKPQSSVPVNTEQFEESMPVIISIDEAVKRSGIDKDEISSTEGRAVFVFRPSAITNPYILDFIYQNREAIGKLNDICPSYTCYSGNNLENLGNKWAFDLKGAACQHGMILYDGKNEPVLIYGILDFANILRKFGKKPTTDRAMIEQLRLDNFKMEAPKGSPVPEWIGYDDDSQDYMSRADDCIYRGQNLSAQANLRKITKEHPHYAASLLLWAKLMINRKDASALKRIYGELLELLPEYKEYWNDMLAKVG